jgi:hypothetical protein
LPEERADVGLELKGFDAEGRLLVTSGGRFSRIQLPAE